MSLKPAKVLLFAAIPCLGTASVFAQNVDRPYENNPYSRYALGEEQNAINPAIKAMGNISAAFSDPYIINTDNPASYATIKNFTYEAGAEGRTRSIFTANDKYRTGNATISYLNLAIPMGKFAGGVIGFRPQTKVSYYLYDTMQTLLGASSKSYTGTGGVNHFFVGAAGTYKGLSIGANVGYLFGTIRQESFFKTQSTVLMVNNSEFTRINNIGGMYYKLGALYENNFSKDYTLRAGVNAELQQNIGTELNEFWISHPFYASDTVGADTAFSNKNLKQQITLPSSYAFGLQLAKGDKWMLGVNYKTTDWSQFKNPGVVDSIGKSAYRMSVGGEYTPDVISIYNYWKRVTYRAGFYYGQDFVSVNGYQAKYNAITFGLSLPFKQGNDRIHTAFEIGKMGKTTGGNLQQNFVRFSLGLSFNNKSWFVKRKYD